MTCVVGIEHDGDVLMMADSSAVVGWVIWPTTTPKIVRVGEVLIGYTSSFRMGQILQYHVDPPECVGGIYDPAEYVVKCLIPEIRKSFSDYGYMGKEDDGRESGGQFLIGCGGRLFSVHTDFQVLGHLDGYHAVGIGQEFALGSLATTDENWEPGERLYLAMRAAEKFSAGVMGPYQSEILCGVS